MRIALLALTLALVGCSSVQKMAVRSATPILVDGSDQLSLERNWDFFRHAMPSNLKLFEMLYLQDQSNLDLLSAIIKGYAAYGFGVFETEYLGDELAGRDSHFHKRQAIDMYTRSLDYGTTYLMKKGIKKKDLLSMDEKTLHEHLKSKLSKRDLKAVLFTAQSWGSLINLQKDNVALIAQVPRVKILFDWACTKEPAIENGVCDLYYAQYEASRPRMLGGNPEKAKGLYLAAITKRPKSLLVRVSYIQFSLLPGFESGAYEAEAKVLREEFVKWEDIGRDTLEDNSEYKVEEHLNLFNTIARKRFEYMEANKKKLFEGL